MRYPRWFAVLFMILLASPALAMVAGRTFDPKQSFNASLSLGQITDIQGHIQETSREVFDVEGHPQSGQVDYTLDELGLSHSDLMYGVELEKMWRYVTLRLDASYFSADANAVAPRDVFLAVDDITFNGQHYDHQKLEDGEPYQASFDAYYANFASDITPFTLNPSGIVQATPWVHIGILALTASYDVDQGPATGLQDYENPPRTYVVRGHGSGDESIVTPEIGLGGELKFNFAKRHDRNAALALDGTYSIFQYHGNARDLGVGEADKDLDLDYYSYEFRARLEWPLTAGTDLLVGGSYRVISAVADSKTKDRSAEETEERREKFDKHIDLDLTMITGFVGIGW